MYRNEKLRKRLDRVKNYCQQTSLHGWAYVAGEKGLFGKLVWLVAMIGFVTLAINFLSAQMKEYNEVKKALDQAFYVTSYYLNLGNYINNYCLNNCSYKGLDLS